MAAPDLTFTSWQRSALFDHATVADGRMHGTLSLTLVDSAVPDRPATGEAPFALMAAADIAALTPAAIRHLAPAAGANDAETTKCVHVDFTDADLPWRYTPETGTPQHVRPWLVLLVGAPAEATVSGATGTFSAAMLKDYPLASSWLWAHQQYDGPPTVPDGAKPPPDKAHTVSRVLSLRPLAAQTQYVAALVPAFNAAGLDQWDGSAAKTIPVLHSWSFATGEAGDFETLAAALQMPPAGDVGKASLLYRRAGKDFGAPLEVRGALTSLQQQETPAADQIAKIRADLEEISTDLSGLDGPKPIGLPLYGRPWLPEPHEAPSGWPHDLNIDPRHRSVAGLGLWMGVEGQDSLMRAAVEQAGALHEAAARVGQLAAGLWAAGSLWNRAMPAGKADRLRVLGTMTARLLTNDTAHPASALAAITGPATFLDAALFSSAAQRLQRPGALSAALAAGALDHGAALSSINEGPEQPEEHPDSLASAGQGILGEDWAEAAFGIDLNWLGYVLETLARMAAEKGAEYRNERRLLTESGEIDKIAEVLQETADDLSRGLADSLQHSLEEIGAPCEGRQLLDGAGAAVGGGAIEFAKALLDREEDDELLYGVLQGLILRCVGRGPCRGTVGNEVRDGSTICDDVLGGLGLEAPVRARPIDLDGLSDALVNALDPRQPDGPARRRVGARLEGVDLKSLAPVQFPLGLDYPTWSLLRQHDREWLLPGAEILEKNSITALQTNPTFIDAFMMGINTQFLAEARWRGLPVDRLCTPLRMFWGQVDYTSHTRSADVEPFLEWAKAPAEPLGSLAHQAIKPAEPGAAGAERLVVIFNSALFRRYPSTLVYLVKPPPGDPDPLLKAKPELDMPVNPPGGIDAWRRDRKYFGPSFSGTLSPDLVFFTFDVAPATLADYWLVLDEPPAELRFKVPAGPVAATNSADLAAALLDEPTRVAISGAELLKMAQEDQR
jgi:hypothetical protein